MARIRTFIAIKLSKSVVNSLIDLQEEMAETIPNVRWVTEDNLHLTLLFLGEVQQLDVVQICRILKKVCAKHSPFALDIAGIGAFPNLRRPKIVWAGVTEGAEALQALHEELETPLYDLGCYRREDRAYTPHLTLGRINRDENEETNIDLKAYRDWVGGTTQVEEVLVMSSELRREGPEYTVMGRARLGG